MAVAEIKPAYLIAGDDEAKIAAALARLRSRAEREGGVAALESFDPPDGQGPPDVERLAAATALMSLTASRRYLVADRVERLDARSLESLAAAVRAIPPDVTVVLIEHDDGGRPSKSLAAARRALREAVEAAGGETHTYQAPRTRDLPARMTQEARRRGFTLDPDAARMLVDRMGESTIRLQNELDRLALWAGPDGSVTPGDLEGMVADTSEEAAWRVSDAIVCQDPAAAVRVTQRLLGQGEAVTPLVYQAAKRLREADRALAQLERGVPQRDIESGMPMHPYAAKMLLRQVRGRSSGEVRAAACAIADLEWWTRGGSDYPDDVALTLAVRRAAGFAARGA